MEELIAALLLGLCSAPMTGLLLWRWRRRVAIRRTLPLTLAGLRTHHTLTRRGPDYWIDHETLAGVSIGVHPAEQSSHSELVLTALSLHPWESDLVLASRPSDSAAPDDASSFAATFSCRSAVSKETSIPIEHGVAEKWLGARLSEALVNLVAGFSASPRPYRGAPGMAPGISLVSIVLTGNRLTVTLVAPQFDDASAGPLIELFLNDLAGAVGARSQALEAAAAPALAEKKNDGATGPWAYVAVVIFVVAAGSLPLSLADGFLLGTSGTLAAVRSRKGGAVCEVQTAWGSMQPVNTSVSLKQCKVGSTFVKKPLRWTVRCDGEVYVDGPEAFMRVIFLTAVGLAGALLAPVVGRQRLLSRARRRA